jgi:peptidoglycan/xylan/chitin deacetylase (PgdA/CDA1 family)
MSTLRSLRRVVSLLLAALLAIGLLLGSAAPAAGATYPVRLEAGPQTGYKFDAAGTVLSSRAVTYQSPFDTTADARTWIGTRGVYLRVTTGTLAGYYVRESPVAHVKGLVVTKTFPTPTRVAFPIGRYLGYKFDSAWGLASTKYFRLTASSGASATRRGMINGRPYAEIVNGIWAGYWVPIVSPSVLTASPIACTVPAKVPAGSQQVFRRLPGAANEVALTFDMGGRLTPALDILERLVVDRVCATIFPTGATSETAGGRQVMAFIAAHPELFEVGNHTYYHCNFRDGGQGVHCPASPPSASFIANDMARAAAVIRNLTGREPAPYWRPPYGAYDTRVLNAVAAAGYTKTFMWDIDTIDWRPVSARPTPGPTAAQIASKVVTNAVDGSVVLMHLGGYNTYDALPSMVYRLRAGGFTPTSASDILRPAQAQATWPEPGCYSVAPGQRGVPAVHCATTP